MNYTIMGFMSIHACRERKKINSIKPLLGIHSVSSDSQMALPTVPRKLEIAQFFLFFRFLASSQFTYLYVLFSYLMPYIFMAPVESRTMGFSRFLFSLVVSLFSCPLKFLFFARTISRLGGGGNVNNPFLRSTLIEMSKMTKNVESLQVHNKAERVGKPTPWCLCRRSPFVIDELFIPSGPIPFCFVFSPFSFRLYIHRRNNQ